VVTELEQPKTVKPEVKYKKITVFELNNLGYRLGERRMKMGSGNPAKYLILEIWNEDNKKDLSFCFLYSVKEQAGVILPHTYTWYITNPLVI